MNNMNPSSREAYQLLQDGALALAQCEQHGMRVDLKYIAKQQKKIDKEIGKLEDAFKATKFYKRWNKSSKVPVNIYSDEQLRTFLYDVEGHKIEKYTKAGKGSTDGETLTGLNISDLEDYLKIGKFKTLKDTFLVGLEREAIYGVVHPFFHLHLARTFRGCIAKGTKILVMRKFKKEGVPIEKVKKGDFVYCFDNDLNPAIRKVEWSGKTGNMEVVRVHWSSKGKHKNGYLDCTPDHRIRLIDGSYVEAQHLMSTDTRSKKEKKRRLPKVRTLSCFRNYDTLNFTGHLSAGKGIYEHRLIYKERIGDLSEDEIVHHKDHMHLNHAPKNLQKLSKSDHACHHVETTLNSKKARRRNVKVVKRNWKKGKYSNAIKSGFDNENSLRLTKYQVIRLLFEASGQLTKVNHDFDTIKKYCKLYQINVKQVKLRFDARGCFVSKTRLQKLHNEKGIGKLVRELGINNYSLHELFQLYKIPIKTRYANQFGEYLPNNHVITKVEWIKKKVDVYDLTVKDYNNFIANEICVHNSSSAPNFQNQPKRDKMQMKVIRGAIKPSKGHQLMELDYSQLEVRVAAAFHNDPRIIEEVETGHDFHTDLAKEIFKIKKFDKTIEGHGTARGAAKNGFVFPQFYGDYYASCAEYLACNWMQLPKYGEWKKGQGIKFGKKHISDHLIKKGITELGLAKVANGKKDWRSETGFTKHIKQIEKGFWDDRYPVYKQWKKDWHQEYLKKGYFYNKTGFTYQGVMAKNDVINYPVQGSAFHVLLWSLVQLTKVMKRERWKTRIIGQIHDAIVFDLHPDERDHVINVAKCIMENDVRQHWKWINVPLHIECELCPVDAAWSKKEDYKI